MKTEIISTEYMRLQEEITSLYEKWVQTLSQQTIVKKEKMDSKQYPLIPQVQLLVNNIDYLSFLEDLFNVIKEYKSELQEELERIKSLLEEDTLSKWFNEALMVNSYYFNEWAEKNHVSQWLPLFAAEHAVRPYLQMAARELEEDLPKRGHHGACPCCGEPARLAVINSNGKKEITCPRCHYAWEQKKISCAHCGTEAHGEITVLRLEEDDRADVYVCNTCKGYTKVIDSRKLIVKPTAELLDLQTIHLDYIAQEKGYGIESVTNTH